MQQTTKVIFFSHGQGATYVDLERALPTVDGKTISPRGWGCNSSPRRRRGTRIDGTDSYQAPGPP